MFCKKFGFLAFYILALSFFSSKTTYAQNFCIIDPNVQQSGLEAQYCLASPVDTLMALPRGGTWSGSGMVDSVFNPLLAGVGTHVITYTLGGYAIDTSITFSPVAGTGTAVTMFDDDVQGAFAIGFSFDFFGNSYSNFYISSNGFITFNNDFNSGCCSGDELPETFTPNNVIAFAWEDLYPPGAGTIEYFTAGTAPNRQLIVNFNGIPWCCNSTPRVTSQLILYETTNVIEIHATSIEADGDMTMGIENSNGTVAHVVPGRNSTDWNIANQGIRFTPDSCMFTVTDTTVVNSGPGIIALSDTCNDFGSIMEFTTTTDTAYIYNNGCDTLFVSSLSNTLSAFIINPDSGFIIPGDSLLLEMTFAPTASITFNDTLHILNNDVDTFICLTGMATGAPAISFSPPNLSLTTLNCCDTSSTTITVGNLAPDVSLNWSYTVPPIFTEDFDPFIDPSNWSSTIGGFETLGCNADSGNAWLMNGGGLREIITNDLNVSAGGTVDFRVYMSNGSDGCNAAEGGEDVYLDYSINGGASWVNFGFYDEFIFTPTFSNVSENIPVAAQTGSTRFRWRQINHDCTNCDIAMIDDIAINSSFVQLSPSSSVIGALGSTVVDVDFISCGLVAGVYQDSITLSSNDPVNPNIKVPYTFTLNGPPIISTSASCLDMDTAMLGATNIDSVFISNLGCDTLDVTSIVNNLSIFSVDTSSFILPPGDSIRLRVSFIPIVTGTFNDTLIINNNDITDTICLVGVAVPAPSISVDPGTLIVNSSTCCDTTTVQLKIKNGSPLANLDWNVIMPFGIFEDFDSIVDVSNWEELTGGYADTACAADRGNAWIMNDVGLRQLITKDIDVSNGGNVDFRVYMSDGTDGCNAAEGGEDVLLDYSINGGVTWINFGFYDEAIFTPTLTQVSQAIPLAAQTTSTRFRFWQRFHDFNGDAISVFDDISIQAIGYATPSVSSSTTAPSDSTLLDFNFVSCGQEAGVYTDSILITSNDPLIPQLYVPFTYTVSGNAEIAPSDSCINNDTIIELTTRVDTVIITNTGCDTLVINNISTSLPEYTLRASSTLRKRIAQSSDDAEQQSFTGAMNLTSSDLEMVTDGTSQFVGMRFQNINLPQGASIISAHLEFESEEVNFNNTSITFVGEAVDSSSTFITTSFNISLRPQTTASITWSLIPEWSVGLLYDSPDLSAIIQEIVDRPQWSSGNPLSIIAFGGFGERTAFSFDGDSTKAPVLVVEYSPATVPISILPNELIGIETTFSPLNSGTYNDNLLIQTNVGDTNVCLMGVAIDAPTISFNPDSLSKVINSCCDSIVDSVMVYNIGASNLIYSTQIETQSGSVFSDGFESGNISTWTDEGGTYTKQVTTTDPATGTYAAEMVGGDFNVAPNGISHSFQSSTPDYISFRIKNSTNTSTNTFVVIGDNPAFWNSGIIYIHMNGSGNIFVNPIGNVIPYSANQWYFIEMKNINFTTKRYDLYIDGVLESSNVSFTNTAVNTINEVHLYGFTNGQTSWFDDIQIGEADWLVRDIVNDTIVPGDSSLINLDFSSCGLNTGMHSADLVFSSNDPVNSSDTLSLDLQVNGTPQIILSDSCLIFDTIMEFTTDLDTFQIYNTGCDTLNITSASNTLSEYTFFFQTSSRVNANTDDAEEERPSGFMNVFDFSLNLVNDGIDQMVGLRFRDLGIPQGATIVNAYIEFEADALYSDATNLTINGEAIDSSSGFNTTLNNISSRTLTGSSVAWDNIPIWTFGSIQQSPDVTSIVQEIVNRAGWDEDNAMSFVFQGTGHRSAESYDDDPVNAPLLVIDYVRTSGTIVAGDSVSIMVQFSPTSTGLISDVLTIQNNDVDTSICLQGFVLPRPIVGHNPDSLSATLACCDSLVDTLTIYNTGLGGMNYSIPSCASTSLQSVLDSFNTNFSNITALVPSIFNFSDGVFGNSIGDGGGDMYDGGNRLNTNLGFSIPYSDNLITSNAGVGPTGSYFTRKHPGLFVFAADIDGVDYFEITGNLGADGGGTASDEIITLTNSCGTFTGFVKRVSGAGDPSVNHLIIVEDHPSLSHTWSTNTDNDQHRVLGLTGASTTRIYYLLYASSSGGFITRTEHEAIMLEFLNSIKSDNQFSVSPFNGIISPGDSAKVAVTFNSCGENAGTIQNDILINSNDPLRPQDTVIATMTVVGAPILELSDACLDLDSIVEFTTHTDTFYVRNVGCDTLFVSNITNTLAEYTVDTSSFFVPIADSMPVIVTFSPMGVGVFEDTLTIISNLSDTTVCLTGDAFPRPILSVSPNTISGTVPFCCDTIVDSMIIYNTGGSPLTWQLSSPTNLTDDFDPGIDLSIWSVNTGVANTSCGSVSGNALHFSNNGLRSAATIDLNTLGGGDIEFELIIGTGGSPCENVDPGEDIVLEYSTNGGASYTIINTYFENTFPTFTFVSEAIPAGAQTAATRFRWRQLSHSGTIDNWSIDNVSILQFTNSELEFTPSSGTTAIGDSSVVLLSIHPCNTNPGVINYEVVVNSNDPINVSDTTTLTITKQAIPVAPIANDTTICFGDPTPDLAATFIGDSVYWYDDPALTNRVNIGSVFATGETAVGTYTYYATQFIDNCEGLSDTVTLTINGVPGAPVGSDEAICLGDPVPSLTAVGLGTILWFDDAALTNLVFTGNPFATGETAVGTHLYYAVDSVGGCTSILADTVSLAISPLPAPPVSADTLVCNGAPVPDLTATGTNIEWYTDPTLVFNTFSGSPFATGITAPGTHTFYVTQNPSGCESLADTVTLTISSTPLPTANDDSVCDGGTVPDLVASGTNIKWYDDVGLTNQVFTGSPFATGETAIGVYTYYVTQTIGGCESAARVVTLSINAIPSAPTGPDIDVCFGSPIPDLTAVGTGIKWYDDAALTNLVFTGSPFTSGNTAVGTYTYYATQTISGCESPIADTIVLNINPVPTQPTALDTVVCVTSTIPDLVATGTNLHWYDDALLTNEVFVGSPFPTGETLAGAYTFYVTDSSGGCHSIPDTSVLVINALPAVPLANDPTICFGQALPNLTAVGSNIRWYNDTALNNLVFSGNNFNTGLSSAGLSTFFVTDSVEACPASSPDTATVTIHALPSIPISLDTGACFGDTIPDLSAVGTNIKWYDDAALSNLVFSGTPFSTGDTSAGTHTYYVTQTDVNACESEADTVNLIISTTPTPSSSGVAICDGDPVPDLTAVGTDIKWYDDIGLTNLVFTGDTFATGSTAVGIHTFYVTQTLSGCESAAATVILAINTIPSAPATSDDSVCFGAATPDLTATGSNIQWYSDSALTSLVGSGSPFATGETAVGVYTYYVTQTVTSCESPAAKVTLSINASPLAPASSDELICFGTATPDLIASGTNIRWYDDVALTNLVFSGSVFATGETGVGTYTYYATQTNAGCESPASTVILTISSQPVTPNVADTAICFGASTPDLTATGTIIQWYDDAALTNLVNTGSPFITGNTAVGTYTYYVTDSTAGCPVSMADSVNLTINAAPLAPTALDDSVCIGLPVPDLSASGTNIRWYDDIGLTNLVFSGSPFATGETTAGTHTYYATQTLAGCESPSLRVDLIINPVPSVPVASDTQICVGSVVPNLTAIGSNIRWYDDGALTNLVFSGSSFATGVSSVGVHTYFVTQTIAGCESLADTVNLTIHATPLAPIANDTSTCEGSNIPDLLATGTSIKWYDDGALSNLVFSGSPFNTGNTLAGTYTYYATQTNINGCESSADTVVLSIHSIPSIPIAMDTGVCLGDPIPDLSAVGTTIKWYDDAGLTNLVFSGSPFATGETSLGTYSYYVTQTDNNSCESSADTVVLSINSLPLVPIASDTSVCEGSSIPNLTASGVNVRWYDDGALSNLVFSGSSFATGETAVGTYTYYVTQSNASCESSADTVTLTINSIPLAPIAIDTTVCEGSPIPDLTASGTNVKWYDDAALTNLVFSGASYTTGETSVGVYTYYVTQTNSDSCESSSDTVSLIINLIPTAPVATDTAVCEGASIPNLTASGANIKWYDDGALTNLVFSGSSYATGETTAGTYTFYVTQTLNGCESSSDTVNLTITANPNAPVSGDTSVCEGTTIPNLTAVGTNIRWYGDAALTNLLFSGTSYATGETTVGIYTFYVTQSVSSCESPADTVVLTIKATPAVPVAADTGICFGSTTPNLTAIGTAIKWYDDAALSNLVFSGSSFSSGDTAIGTHTYYVTQTVNACESPADTVVLNIDSVPLLPVSSDDSVCFGSPVPSLIATGTNIKWYDDNALTNLVFSGSTFSTGDTAIGIYIYYATQTVNGCESGGTEVILKIDSVVAPPIGTDTAICFGDPTPDLTASGISLSWYDDAALTNLVFSGSSFATGNTAVGTYTYYVTQNTNGCESLADTVVLMINPSPVKPSVVDTTICFGSPTPDLIASGTILSWYDDPALTNLVFTGDTFTSGLTVVGSYTFYVNDSTSGCTASVPDTVVLSINAIPPAPTAIDDSICFGSPNPDLIATGTNLQWYDDGGLTNLIASGTMFKPNQTVVGIHTFYVSQTQNACEGPADTVSLTIRTIPNPPLAIDTTVCFGTAIPNLTAQGLNISWYDDAALTNLVGTGNSFSTGQTNLGTYVYYVTQDSLGCPSLADSVSLIIDSPLLAPNANDTSVCVGGNIPDLEAVGLNNARWYSDNLLSNLVHIGSSYATGLSLPGTYTFYVADSSAGCGLGPATEVILEIFNITPAPAASDASSCFGDQTPDLNASGTNLRWYDDSLLTNLVATGNVFISGETAAGIYAFYVTDSLTGCGEGAATRVRLIINESPSIPNIADTISCFGDIISFSNNGSSMTHWFSKDGTLLSASNTFTPTNQSVGFHEYLAADSIQGCPMTATDTFSLAVNPRPLVRINFDSIRIDHGDEAILEAFNAQLYTWSPPIGLDTTEGAIVKASPALNTTYTVVGTSMNGCFNTDSVLVLVTPVGLNENDLDINDLLVYPNPSRNGFVVEFTLDKKMQSLSLINALGQSIHKESLRGLTGVYHRRFELKYNKSGLYYIKVQTSEGALLRKVIILPSN